MPAPILQTPRLVLDTNICLDLFVFEDARSATLLSALDRGHVEAVTNDACRDEWRRVLRYPKLALSEDRCSALEAQFDASITLLPAHLCSLEDTALPRCEDADDQKFLELARDTNAAALVTKDRLLLKLWRRVARAGLFAIVPPEMLVHQALWDPKFWASKLGN